MPPVEHYYTPGRYHRPGRGDISAQMSEDCSVALDILAQTVAKVGPDYEGMYDDIDERVRAYGLSL